MKNYKQITCELDLSGKTIERIADYDGEMFIFFTDETFCALQSAGYELRYIELIPSEHTLKLDKYNHLKLKSLGLISQEEYNAIVDKNRKAEIAKKEKEEMELFVKLKQKYA